MRLRTLAVSLVPLLAASAARAQAPGEVVAPVVVAPVVVAPVIAQPMVVAPGMTPMMAPAPDVGCVAPCVDCRPSVMNNRWAIGLSIGSMSLAPKDSPDDQTGFAVGELALRFRATPHLELELSAGGGREQTADHMDGDLEVTTAMIAARWRFRPEAAWNWYLTAGIGGAAVTRHDATDQERHDATQPAAMLGIGLERRFEHFALQAELRGVGLGKAKQDATTSDPPAAQPAMTTTTTTTTTDPNAAGIERSGASVSIGLSYYF